MRHTHWFYIILTFILAMFAGMPVLGAMAAHTGAVEVGQSDLGYPEIRLEGVDYAFEGVPETVEAGYIQFTLENTGEDIHHAQIVRINDEFTYEEVEATLPKTVEEFEDPALLDELFTRVTLTGGMGIIPPGFTTSVVLNLDPGVYVLFCGLETPDGDLHSAKGMMARFDVVAPETASGVEPPAADITVDMADFSYTGLDEPLAAGPHIVEVVNNGPEPHEMLLFQLNPGATVEEVLAFLEAGEEGPPPGMPFGGMQVLMPGQTGWLVQDFAPGAYAALCFVSSPANDHQPHLALGMLAEFTVEEAS